MASVSEHNKEFATNNHLPHWSQLEDHGSANSSNSHRPSMVRPEPPRPVEPGESQDVRRPYVSTRNLDGGPAPPRQQLPGVHELLSPVLRTGPRSPGPGPGTWAPINNPPSWQDRILPNVNGSAHSQNAPHVTPAGLAPPYRHPVEMTMAESYRANMHPPIGAAAHRPPSLPALPLRQAELSSPTNHGHHDASNRMGEYFSSPSYHTLATFNMGDDRMSDRRPSSSLPGKTNAAGGVFSLQIVGQRDIPGEGLCYVFKDGSTCPTVIDGEPVNPLWGTTKAGKARKRLAQACLNCREKKIKCEPGETSCLQCEKAKRECQRPSISQTQAEMATGATLGNSAGPGEWKSQTSPRSTSTVDIPAPKRRRSAHIAQQESSFDHSSVDAESPRSESKRRKSDDELAPPMKHMVERTRKDSKRPNTDDDEMLHTGEDLGKMDVLAQAEDPYRIDPDATRLFLDLFFAQSGREIRLMFPKRAFTRWVVTCNSKCQRECMVLYAVLALGSAFSNNQFVSFARLCSERATQAAASNYGRFSMALVQTRLLLGAYNNLKGREGLAWDYNGSALRALGAMRLNTEEGCGEELDEYTRPYFSFTREQLRECRRRTFWTGFLMDRYNGFCSGLLNVINEVDIHLSLPCEEQTYEDGSASKAPLFHSSETALQAPQHPAAHVIHVSNLWKEVMQFMHRSTNFPPSTYPEKYESFLDHMQNRLADWNHRLPHHLRYSRETLDRAIYHDYAGDFISMHTLYLFSHLKLARMVRYDLLPPSAVARSICTAHSHALQLLALLRDVRVLTLPGANHNRRTTDFMSPFITYAVSSAIDTLGAGGLREEIVATKQVLNTAIEVLLDLSRYCSNAWSQLRMAEKRLAEIESCPPERDIRTGKGTDGGRCWRITEPMEKFPSLRQDVMYGVSSSTFAEALTEGRKR